MTKKEDEDLFTQLGLKVEATDDIKVGGVYPLYGAITEVVENTSGDPASVKVILNGSITLTCILVNKESVEKMKSRAFEPGIFVTEITEINPPAGNCSTVIFGRSQATEA